jgi:ParB-like chromosome segregation protein Spo0J
VSTESDYLARAEQHAPKTIEEARAAAQRLLAEGYSDHGIAAALGLAVDQVRRMLGDFANHD